MNQIYVVRILRPIRQAQSERFILVGVQYNWFYGGQADTISSKSPLRQYSPILKTGSPRT